MKGMTVCMEQLLLLVPFTVLALIFNIRILSVAKEDDYDSTTYKFSNKFSINVLMAILILASIALFVVPKDFSYIGTALLILWFGTVPHRIFISYKNFLRTEKYKDLFTTIIAGALVFIIYWRFLVL
ncbi:hypothetical protein [Wukongibacter baidiensis]